MSVGDEKGVAMEKDLLFGAGAGVEEEDEGKVLNGIEDEVDIFEVLL